MSKKNKLILSIAIPIFLALILTALLLIFCLDKQPERAVSKARGGIYFAADGTSIAVSKALVEDETYSGDLTNKLLAFETNGQDENKNSWQGLKFEFVEKEEAFVPITITFEVSNYGDEKIFTSFDVIKNEGNNFENITISVNGNDVILPNGKEEYSITFTALKLESSSLDNFEIRFDFSEEQFSEVKGDIVFEGDNCDADISNAKIENGTFKGNLENKLKDFSINFTDDSNLSDEAINSWKDLKLKFVKAENGWQQFVIEFDITNNLEERLLIGFDIKNGLGVNSENISIEFIGDQVVDSYSNSHYKIKFACSGNEIAKLDKFEVKLTLKREEVSWVNGSINFIGENFDAVVSNGSVLEGTVKADIENKLKGFSFLDNTGLEMAKKSWQNLKLQFVEKDEAYLPFALEFDIANNVEERLFVNFEKIKGLGENSDNILLEVEGGSFVDAFSSQHYKIKFSCADFIPSKLYDFQIDISFVKEEIAKVNGDISFEGEDIKLYVSNGVLTSGILNGEPSSKLQGLNFEDKGTADFNEKLNSWKNLNIKFEKENFVAKPINLHFNITNNGEDDVNLNFDCIKGLGTNVDKISLSVTGANTIASGETEEYIVSFTCSGNLRLILDGFSIKITIIEEISARTNGKITFYGENINALISAGAVTEGSYEGNISGKMREIKFDTSLPETETNKQLSTWRNISLKFVESDGKFMPISIKFQITNNGYERYDLKVDVIKGEGVNTNNIQISTTTIRRIASLNTLNFTIKLSANEIIKSKLNDWEVRFTITKNYEAREIGEEGHYQNMYFELTNDSAISDADPNLLGRAVLSRYDDDETEELVIPAYIQTNDGIYRVTSIKDGSNGSSGTFANNTKLKTITLPNTIEKIGDYAFYSCSYLTTINMNKTLKNVGKYAFYYCYRLESALLPDTVVTIGECAFYYCPQLSKFVIPANIREIKSRAFYFCRSLTEIVIPSRVRIVGESAFESCYALEKIVFPLSTTYLYDRAFYNCQGLTSIYIGLNVREIGKNVFGNCPSLEEILVNPNNIYFGDGSGNAIIDKKSKKLLLGCKTTVISEEVTTIGASAFFYSSNLESITIPEDVVAIEENAFDNCTGLKEVKFEQGAKLVSINAYAFQSCKNLLAVNLPDTVEILGSSCFFGCSALKYIHIGKSVREISSNAFLRCSDVESITVSPENVVYEDCNANAIIQKEERKILFGCQNTVLPNDIKIISASAFNACLTLTTINIPESVEVIESGSFTSCSNLKTIFIENQTILSDVSSKYAQGGILRYATAIYVKDGLSVSSYVSLNYTLTDSDVDGFVLYKK